MLSVLIPVYNHNVNNLVKEIDRQLKEKGVVYEFVIIDDGSEIGFKSQNRTLTTLENIQYIENKTNMGRAKIRNVLAQKAQYPYLLFIDCDASVAYTNFIDKYLQAIETMRKYPEFVINGGVAYRKEKPSDEYMLRWYYGKHREEQSARQRQRQPYHHFTPFNVVLTKSIFNHIEFDEQFTTYGHEDSYFGIQLKENKIPYLHIDNPLFHDGLDKNEDYLQKVRISIDNLLLTYHSERKKESVIEDSHLLKTYFRVKSLKLKCFFAHFYQKYGIKIEKSLCKKPNLTLLNLYKLSYIATKNI